jgi:Outer membrane protein beta-barrel domain
MDNMKTAFVLAAFGVVLATPVLAQSSDDRVRLSFGAGLMAGGSDGELSLSGSAGYRFAERFSFDVEFIAAEGDDDRFDPPFRILNTAVGSGRIPGTNIGPQTIGPLNIGQALPIPAIFPIPIEGGMEGSTVMMTAGFRYEFPVEGTRFRPYVSGGLGVARTEQEINIALATSTAVPSRISATITSSIPEIEQEFSHTGAMASAGVGASLRVYKELSIDLNARYFRLDRGRNLGSFGGGVSYRF